MSLIHHRLAAPPAVSVLIGLVVLPIAVAHAALGQGSSRHLNPPGLSRPTGYTHVVVSADGRRVYIAGQVAVDSTGQVVGVGDFRAQTEQVFANLRVALASAGASFADVAKTTILITDLRHLPVLREVRARYLDPARLPASTLFQVPALARPEFLLEIEAVAELDRPARP